jgi:hypothetical protein
VREVERVHQGQRLRGLPDLHGLVGSLRGADDVRCGGVGLRERGALIGT